MDRQKMIMLIAIAFFVITMIPWGGDETGISEDGDITYSTMESFLEAVKMDTRLADYKDENNNATLYIPDVDAEEFELTGITTSIYANYYAYSYVTDSGYDYTIVWEPTPDAELLLENTLEYDTEIKAEGDTYQKRYFSQATGQEVERIHAIWLVDDSFFLIDCPYAYWETNSTLPKMQGVEILVEVEPVDNEE